MHLWKLLASFAIRYHILNNQPTITEQESANSTNSSFAPVQRTQISDNARTRLAKLWLHEAHENVAAAADSLKDSENQTVVTTSEPSRSSSATLSTDTGVIRPATPRTSVVQQLPWDISYIKVEHSLSHRRVGSLPKLAWLALTTSIISTVSQPTCARWNCPCSGYPRRVARSITVRNDVPLLRRKTAVTRTGVMELLHKIETRRFKNANHVNALRQCSDRQDENCIIQYLEKNCTVNGLPTQQHLVEHTAIAQFDEFLKESRKLLGSVAMFMDVARREEQRHSSERALSITEDIRLLEEQGIYHLLCSMDKMLHGHSVHRLPKQLACDVTLSRSKSDNRSYVVLHAFQKLLKSIMDRLDKI